MRTNVLLSLALILTATPALAGDRKLAAAKYKEGEAAFARKDFAKAAEAFEVAYREDPRGSTIYNAALSWQALASNARAADDFERAARAADLPPDLQSAAQSALAKLDAVLVHVKVAGPPGSRFTGAGVETPTPTPFTFRAMTGRYTLHVTLADGHEADKPFEASTPGDASIDVTPAPPALAAATATEAPPEKRTELRGLFGKATLPVAIGFGAGAVAFGVLWAGLGVASLGARDEFAQSGFRSQDAHDRAVTFRDVANVSAVATLVFASAAVVTLVTIRKVPVEAGVGSVWIRGTF